MKSIHLYNKIMKIGFPIFAIYMIFVHLQTGAYDRILSTASVFIVVLIPWLIRKILHYEMSDILEFVYLLFIFLAHILGSVVNLYASIWWWDLFMHGLSGVFTAILALLILKQFGILNKKNKLFTVIFMICFSLAIASFWEFFEFTADKITGGDTQWVRSTGVDDTMSDMLIAFGGTIIFSSYYFICSKISKGKTLEKLEKLL